MSSSTSQTSEPEIDILLGTFNGSEYLEEQLNSILKQTYQNWRIIARDDGSTDRTPLILADFQKKLKHRFIWIQDEDRNLGACHNFGRLLEYSTSAYVSFCDQDDVWIETKLETSIKEIKSMEKRFGFDTNLLVHSDLIVVDKNNHVTHPSYIHYQSLNPNRVNFSQLVMQNVVTGCTVLINRRLANQAIPIPHTALMHDWWLALVCSVSGNISFIEEPLIRYRQHGKNAVGAKKMNFKYLIGRLKDLSTYGKTIHKTIEQAISLRKKPGILLQNSEAETLKAIESLKQVSYLKKRYLVIRHSLWKSGLVRNLVFFLMPW